MKTNWMLFVGLAIFYVIMTIVYWYVDGEPLGITGLMLSAGLAGMVGFYVWFTQKRIGKILIKNKNVFLSYDRDALHFSTEKILGFAVMNLNAENYLKSII